MTTDEAYVEGFVKRASEYGFSEAEAVEILKQAEGTMAPNTFPYGSPGVAVDNAPYKATHSAYANGPTFQPNKQKMPFFDPGAVNALSGRYDKDPMGVISERMPGYSMIGKPLSAKDVPYMQTLPRVLTPSTTMDQVKATPGMMQHVAGSPENADYLKDAIRQQARGNFPSQIKLK